MRITLKQLRRIIREERDRTFGGWRTDAGLSEDDLRFVDAILAGEEEDEAFLGSPAYEVLFDYFASEMPYGVMKARTGEPDMWILDRLRNNDTP